MIGFNVKVNRHLISLLPGFRYSLLPLGSESQTSFVVPWEKIENSMSGIVELLSSCEQDRFYHPEGDVWTHTKMVCNYLVEQTWFQALDIEERHLLFLACLFHDIGKPFVSRVEKSRITSPRHSIVGARVFREIVINSNHEWHIELPWYVRELVASMILLHTLPFHFVDKKDCEFSVIAAAEVVPNYLLHMLGMADINGRGDRGDPSYKNALETVNYFLEYCHELGVYSKPFVWWNNDMRFRYLFLRKGFPSLKIDVPKNGTVIMMSGIQGSGKSTLAALVYPTIPSIGFDTIRANLGLKFGENEGLVAQTVKQQCRKLMAEKKDFVFDATNLVKDNRAKWIRLFSDYEYYVKIHYVERGMEKVLKDNRNRADFVPDYVIEKATQMLDFPTILEAHEIEYNIT